MFAPVNRFRRRAESMKLGIMSATFRAHPIVEAARRLREGGFTCTQRTPEFAGLECYRYGRAADLSGLTPEVRRRIRNAYAAEGVEVLSQGAYMERTDPDEGQRRANIVYFAARLR